MAILSSAPRRPGQRLLRLAVGKIVGYPGAAAGAASEAYGDLAENGSVSPTIPCRSEFTSALRRPARSYPSGLTAGARLTSGKRIGAGEWRVPATEIRRIGHPAGRVHRPDAGYRNWCDEAGVASPALDTADLAVSGAKPAAVAPRVAAPLPVVVPPPLSGAAGCRSAAGRRGHGRAVGDAGSRRRRSSCAASIRGKSLP